MNNPQRTESETDRLWRIVVQRYKCLKRDGELEEGDMHEVLNLLSRNVCGIPEDIRDEIEQAEDDVLVWLARLGMQPPLASSYVCLVTDKVLCERFFDGDVPGDIPKEDPIWQDELIDPYDGEPCRLFAETYEDYNSRQHEHDEMFPMTDRQLFAELPNCLKALDVDLPEEEEEEEEEEQEEEQKEEKEGGKEGQKPATEAEKLAAEVERVWPADG